MSSAKHKRNKHNSFLETTGIWINRLKTDNADSFLQLFSKENIDAQYKSKPIGTVKMRFLDDRIDFKSASLFGGKPPRHDLHYRNIERFLSMKDYPTTLNLGVIEQDNTMTREMIKFKNESELNEACDLIQKARQHPLFKLLDNDESTANTLSRLSQSSLGLDSPYFKNGFAETEEMQENEDFRSSTIPRRESSSFRRNQKAYSMIEDDQIVNDQTAPVMSYTKNPSHTPNTLSTHDLTSVPVTEEISCRSASYQQLKTWHPDDLNSLEEELTKNIPDKSAWSIDVKCIESHPVYGNKISDNGSIYMFIAHMVPDQRALSLCSSSTGSLNSLTDDKDNKRSVNMAELTTYEGKS